MAPVPWYFRPWSNFSMTLDHTQWASNPRCGMLATPKYHGWVENERNNVGISLRVCQDRIHQSSMENAQCPPPRHQEVVYVYYTA
jgi:hypothetical protein